MKAIRIAKQGGPEVLTFEPIQVGQPGPGQVRIRHTAIGVNFLDTYQRSGLYSIALPSGMGNEAAGVVEAVGLGVDEVKPGDRVAYCGGVPDAYSEGRLYPADRLVKLPDYIPDDLAASVMLKGMTVWYLLHRTYKVQKGDTILFHAAAGGVGQIAVQWLKLLGANVIATVGSESKMELVRNLGANHVIDYTREEFASRVRELTGGAGVAAVYDSVGRATFNSSLDCLRPLGTMVLFGTSSGPVPPFDLGLLGPKGSLFVTRPVLFHYIATRESLEAAAQALFNVVRSGKIRIDVTKRYPLADAATAHRDLEGRRTTGSVVLVP